MNEDQDRNRMDNSPYNLAILRHMALNVMRKEGSKGSLRGKFKRAAWEDAYLRRLLAAFLKCDYPAPDPYLIDSLRISGRLTAANLPGSSTGRLGEGFLGATSYS
jgi:hypothetical protein